MRAKKKAVKKVGSKPSLLKIQSREAYDLTMKTIAGLVKKGDRKLSPAEQKTLQALAAAAELYTDNPGPSLLPNSLPRIIQNKLFQLRINQSLAAQLLGVSNAKFSLIMHGKQKPDIQFLKAVHEKLQVDASTLLKAV